MNNTSFYGGLMFFLGIIGFICSIIDCALLYIYKEYGIKFGNIPYIYFSCIVIICYICNIYLQKRYSSTLLSRIGVFFSKVSLLPIGLFVISILFSILILPFIIIFLPSKL